MIGAVIMVHGDDSGLVLPPYLAPTQVNIIPIQQQKPGVMEACLRLKLALQSQGIRVAMDDSDKSPGWKFSESEMKGIPLRIEIGPRDLENNQCVVARRVDGQKITLNIADVAGEIPALLEDIHQRMYQNALKSVEDHTKEVKDYETFKTIIAEESGYVKMMWCGDVACEEQVKKDTTATSRCMPFDQHAIGKDCPICGKEAKHLVYWAKAY